jgi:DNA-binding beta-propeller fold protein YncE
MKHRGFFSSSLLALPFIAALGCDGPGNIDPPDPGLTPVLTTTPRSSTVALSDDQKILIMVNQDDGTISIFDTEGLVRTANLSLVPGNTTTEPWAVVIAPDNKTAFVLLRNTGAVVQISKLDEQNPVVGVPVLVGSEPTSLVLSPTGDKLYASSFVDGAVYVLQTNVVKKNETLRVGEIIEVGGSPRGLCMTNDFDTDDTDETLFVTNFYSVPSNITDPDPLLAPFDSGEGTDFGRQGIVHALKTDAAFTVLGDVTLAPLLDTGFPDPNAAVTRPTGAFPNQLYSCTVQNNHVYVPNMAASPRGPVKFNATVQGLVSVFDAVTLEEVGNNVGEKSGTLNLNNLVKAQSAPGEGRTFISQPVDVAFVPNSDPNGTEVGYVVSGASDIVLRTVWKGDGTIEIGSAANLHIAAGKNPLGAIIDATGTRMFVANRVSRSLSVIDLSIQADEVPAIASTTVPTDAVGIARLNGQRFFNTSFGRWAAEGWIGCVGCHPDGLSDNVTWHFAAGPRQTIALDGIYDKNNVNDQRILNWTGIFDEVHDFELNTRGVSGGKGAVVDADDVAINLAAFDTDGDGVVENNQGLNGSVKNIVNASTALGGLDDWNEIDAYIQTIRPLNGNRLLDGASVTRGRQVFENNKCQNCHGGAKWTISRRRYTPSVANSTGFRTLALDASGLNFAAQNKNSLHLEAEGGAIGDPNAANLCIPKGDGNQICPSPLQTLRITCVLRDVGTFGVKDPISGVIDTTLEVAADMLTQGQGLLGFNPPSLLSVGATGPYLHHGQAETLEDLFTDKFASHHQSQSVNFLLNLNDAAQQQQKADLIAFLRSIDSTTATIEPDAGEELCPTSAQ